MSPAFFVSKNVPDLVEEKSYLVVSKTLPL